MLQQIQLITAKKKELYIHVGEGDIQDLHQSAYLAGRFEIQYHTRMQICIDCSRLDMIDDIRPLTIKRPIPQVYLELGLP